MHDLLCWGENSVCQFVYARQLFCKVTERVKVMLPFICSAVWGGICSKYPPFCLISLYPVLDYTNKKERSKTLEKFCKLQVEAFPWDNHRYLQKTLPEVYYTFFFTMTVMPLCISVCIWCVLGASAAIIWQASFTSVELSQLTSHKDLPRGSQSCLRHA